MAGPSGFGEMDIMLVFETSGVGSIPASPAILRLFMELIILFLLQIKHWYVDFVLQDDEQVAHKGVYGNFIGISHSIDHIAGNLIVLFLVSFFYTIPLLLIVLLSFIDGILHYHIDWAKMNFGCRNIADKEFWNHLGQDQMAHQICYLLMVFFIA